MNYAHKEDFHFISMIRLPETDQVHYMLAVIYSRQGCDRDAVEHYLKACKLTPSYWHRGNLDPEISAQIRRYDLTKD